MPQQNSRKNLSLLIFVIFLIVSLGLLVWQASGGIRSSISSVIPSNKQRIEISLAYAPELEPILKDSITEFNTSFEKGMNPTTGKNLQNDEKIVRITGQSVSSGEARTKIVAAASNISSNNTPANNSLQPTIYAPTMSGWLNLVNLESGFSVFDINTAESTATSPVGIAIWESHLNLIKKKFPNTTIGYNEILSVSKDPKGWKSLNSNISHQAIFSGFTDPQISSTALSALTMQYYTATANGTTQSEQLSPQEIKNETVQKQVSDFQQLIRHYSSNTVVFRDYISRGPDYLDMVPLAENDIIYVNQGKNTNKPPEKLVMLYPKEGSIVHDYPMAIPQAKWVSDDQRAAASEFIKYIKSPRVQAKYLDNGFRPTNTQIPLSNPVSPDFGVDPNEPKKTLKIPSGEVLSQVQTQWDFVKKTARVVMLLDTSGSMQGEKLTNAKKALDLFMERLSGRNFIGLTHFDTAVQTINQPESLESNRSQIQSSLSELNANGSTALYDGIINSIDQLSDLTMTNQIKAIVVLSDGQDTSSKSKLNDVIKKIESAQSNYQDIIVIPIAYGGDADMNSLNAISRASKTTVVSGQTNDIDKLLTTISSYF